MKKEKLSPIVAGSGKVIISTEIQELLNSLQGTLQDEYNSDALKEMILPVLPAPPYDCLRELQLLQCFAMFGELLVNANKQLDEYEAILGDLIYLAPDEVTKKAGYQNYLKRRVFGSTTEKTRYVTHLKKDTTDDSGKTKQPPVKRKNKSKSEKPSGGAKPDTEKVSKPKGMSNTDYYGARQTDKSQVEGMPTVEGAPSQEVISGNVAQTTTIQEPVESQSQKDETTPSNAYDTKKSNPCSNTGLQPQKTINHTPVSEREDPIETAGEVLPENKSAQKKEPNYEGVDKKVTSPQLGDVESSSSPKHYYEQIHEGCAPSKLLGRKKNYAPRQENLALHRFSEDVVHVDRYTSIDDSVGWRDTPPLDSAGYPMGYHGRKFVHSIGRLVCYAEVIDVYKQVYMSHHVTDDKGTPERRYSPFLPAIEKGMYIDENLFAKMITDKVLYGIPTHRELKMLGSKGIFLPDSTFSQWAIRLYEQRCVPLIEAMWGFFYQCNIGHADATWARVMLEMNKGNRTKSYINCYATGTNEKYRFVLFQYAPTKEAVYFKECLENFSGCIMTDAASELSWIEGGKHACCMAHARQEFFDALPSDPKVREKSRAMEGVKLWDKIFGAERSIESSNPEEHLIKRHEVLAPAITNLENWMIETQKTASPKCKLMAAINYYWNHREELRMCLKDGNVPLTNMLIENIIRYLAVFRKNSMLFGSPAGASAFLGWASLILSANLNNLDCEKFIAHILRNTTGEGWKDPSAIAKLMPWSPECAVSCKKSTGLKTMSKKSDVAGHRFCGQ